MSHLRLVISLVGAATLITIVGIVALAILRTPAPAALQNLAATALGGLIGLLVPSDQRARQDARIDAASTARRRASSGSST